MNRNLESWMSQYLHLRRSHPIALAARSSRQGRAGRWVEEKLHEQADVLAVAIWGDAVMTNHLHAVGPWKKIKTVLMVRSFAVVKGG